ncbi:hypothetical protein TBK1r_02470 [Stieleria magnilauensis]|uniref:Uncharacterized protein n=1 Tax=Stieleria magnilauensis TaxID=2527963 RepID=A0ABX5XHV0_9BACT|nr:hypothetical protein TBK1r_02470 [Planctomycetes bacterium TBK1r]
MDEHCPKVGDGQRSQTGDPKVWSGTGPTAEESAAQRNHARIGHPKQCTTDREQDRRQKRRLSAAKKEVGEKWQAG